MAKAKKKKPRGMEPGNLPKHGADMLNKIYDAVYARSVDGGMSESAASNKAARQAWCQVKRHYHKKGERWVKRKKVLGREEFAPGCAPYRGRRAANPVGDVVMWTGDMDPFAYGGGIVYETEHGPVWHVFPFAEEDLDEGPFGDEYDEPSTTQVFRISVSGDVADEYGWVNVEEVARATGADVEQWRVDAHSPELGRRVSTLEDIAAYYGYSSLDHYPEQMSEDELRETYESDIDKLHSVERRTRGFKGNVDPRAVALAVAGGAGSKAGEHAYEATVGKKKNPSTVKALKTKLLR